MRNMSQLSNQSRSAATMVTVREPSAAKFPKLHDFWDYRYVLWTLILRDLKVRYRHTLLGVLWFILQPFLLMLVITVGLRFVLPGDMLGLPYAVYVASGLVVWIYFSNGFPAGATSLENFKAVISKISIPKALLPLVPTLTSFADLMSASLLLVPILYFYDIVPSWRVIFVPAVCAGLMTIVYGMSLWASAATARFKDVRHIVPFLTQLLFFASPIFISHELVQGKARFLLQLNPLATYLDTFRWCIFPTVPAPTLDALGMAAAISLGVMLSGLFFFQRQQANLIDMM